MLFLGAGYNVEHYNIDFDRVLVFFVIILEQR